MLIDQILQVTEDLVYQRNGIEHILRTMQVQDNCNFLRIKNENENVSTSFEKKFKKNCKQLWKKRFRFKRK